jgi:small-conductance mechanosensitive channel
MSSLSVPIALFVFLLAVLSGQNSGHLNLPLGEVGAKALNVLLWLSGTLLLARLGVVFARRNFANRSRRQAPKLLCDLLACVIWITGLSSLAVAEFGVSPSAALATSGMVIAVIGFAVRSLVADLFYGLMMAIDRPFEIGDWVQLNDGSVGTVREMTWRAVKLVTRENLLLSVPNSKLAMEEVRNFDQPEPFWRKSQQLTLGFDVRPGLVKELWLEAVAQVPESERIPREPEALITGLNEHGIEWELRFWLPDFDRAAEVSQLVHEALLRNLHFAGIRVPRRKEEVYIGQLQEERDSELNDSASWIDQVLLFAAVPQDQRMLIQAAATEHQFSQTQDIVRQGDDGSSLFIVQRGVCEVLIGGENGAEKVGVMGPGSVFGELSLLTGAPRSATVRAATASVVYEITKDDLAPLLTEYPELATEFATVLADRRLADAHRDELGNQAQMDAERDGLIASLVDSARRFFRLDQ